jgi:protein SCO1/2
MLLLIASTIGCSKQQEGSLPMLTPLHQDSYSLTNQLGEAVVFPQDMQGKILVVGYIYTHCPDICMMTTVTMKQVYEQVQSDTNIIFVSVTFDPERDTPQVLKKFAGAYDIQLSEKKAPWFFLSGSQAETDRLMKTIGIFHERNYKDTDSTHYFIDHSDKISIVDTSGTIRKHYKGSTTPPDTIIADLRILTE